VNIHTILKSVLCFACLFFGIAHSAIITVNGTDGAVADDGFCSISEAIMAANDDASVSGAAGECNAGNGIDTLNLSTNIILDTVIENSTLGISGTPNISSTIIIDGMGFSVVRDTELECSLNGSPDSGEFRIITINDMGNLTLKNINLINGCADGIGKDFNDHDKGGSILNEGQLSIENSTLSGNQAFTGTMAVVFITMELLFLSKTALYLVILRLLEEGYLIEVRYQTFKIRLFQEIQLHKVESS